jgi:hypothetical protein
LRLALLTFVTALFAQPASVQTDLYLVALMGQSNMSGLGEIAELPGDFPKNPTKIWNFTNAYRWEPAKEPIDSPEGQVDTVSLDKRTRGVGPALALADAFVSRHPTTSVGLIPCAKGATSIENWLKTTNARPRDTLFGSCINRIKTVSPANGNLRAVIFWQGGTDTKRREDAFLWGSRFTRFVSDIREELGNPNLPIIMVTLGNKPPVVGKRPYWEVVREQQEAIDIPGVIKIESDGYARKDDWVHFATEGQLAFGPVLAGLLPAP